jgi:prepilin-type N-terminal cleavage/methylation domain-containing protein
MDRYRHELVQELDFIRANSSEFVDPIFIATVCSCSSFAVFVPLAVKNLNRQDAEDAKKEFSHGFHGLHGSDEGSLLSMNSGFIRDVRVVRGQSPDLLTGANGDNRGKSIHPRSSTNEHESNKKLDFIREDSCRFVDSSCFVASCSNLAFLAPLAVKTSSVQSKILGTASLRQNPKSKICRAGFTMIELMTVMFIILLLMGLLFAGMKQWGNSAARASTVSRLELLNNTLGEIDAAGHQEFVNTFMTPNTVAKGWVATDASAYGNVTGPANVTPPAVSVNAGPNGTGGPAYNVTNSRSAAINEMVFGYMSYALKFPVNAKGVNGLPSNALANSSGTPVVLDGWGNPIIFCLPPGLTNVFLHFGTSQAILVGPAPQNTTQTAITSPDGRPFFVSAGADGDFTRGDDNMYSFQQGQ